ncbi:Hsp20/alpha crystallin family protein [Oleidesulfovibrio alaskensis]|uniref:Hsp20/alpha crystallin family protein n=1 Tax=Oleidesulfovibrio alaskensis TaxID=58180 RepID=UPI00040670DF|nr:Hsp20/alpha crystallin family protein [Oleidesulfovibrio alaskensis]
MVIDFSSLYEMPRSFEKLFDEFARASKGGYIRNATAGLNIVEDDENYYVDLLVPAVDPEKIDLTISDKNLIIRGEVEKEAGKFFRQERGYGSFQRVITLNAPVDRDAVQATCENGILRVVLPKSEAVKPRKIAIS